MTEKLLLIGASVRHLALSASLADIPIVGFDFFGDWDSQQYFANDGQPGGLRKISSYRELTELIKPSLGNIPTIISGGIENHPQILAELAENVKILGGDLQSYRQLANPPGWPTLFADAKLNFPNSHTGPPPPFEAESQWLIKSSNKSGGLGVLAASPQQLSSDLTQGHYFQSRVVPDSSGDLGEFSVSFVTSETGQDPPNTYLLGIAKPLNSQTRQRINAGEFRYCGSTSDIRLSESLRQSVIEIGKTIAQKCNIRGLWGVDLIHANNICWIIDINPRPTASMELFETQFRKTNGRDAWTNNFKSLVDLHIQACMGSIDVPVNIVPPNDNDAFVEIKAIYYLPRTTNVLVTDSFQSRLIKRFDPSYFTSIANGSSLSDIPESGRSIQGGNPLLTVHVRETPGRAEGLLTDHLTWLESLIGSCNQN